MQNWKELENNKQMEYKRLGDYIRPVDVRNRELKVNLSQGICNAKYFQNPKQVAENPETHKIVGTGQFAYNRATTRNGDKISIALREGPDCTVSSAYQVFEIVDENRLNPRYLMMWFKRPEFDRYAIYYSHGSAHEFFEYEAMCDVMLPVPSIDRQREIVSEYETLSNRIRLNEQMIANLEETAQALYRKMFVDGVDKENLPEGWRKGKLGDFGNVITGKTPSTFDEDNFGDYMPFVTIPDMHDGCFVIKTERMLSEKGVKSQVNKTVPQNSICVSCIGTSGLVIITTQECQTNQQINTIVLKNPKALYYLYMVCRDLETIITEYGMGAAVLNNLNKKEFESLMAIIPSNDVLCESYNNLRPLFDEIYICQQENEKLTELQSLLLVRMGK